MSRIAGWLSALLADPDLSPSTTRVCGVLCILAAIGCGIAGVALKRYEAATIVTALGGIGVGCLFARTRSTPNGSASA